MGAADEVRRQVDEAVATFLADLDGLDFGGTTTSGWTVQEMVAHVAFWLETTPPFVTGAFRGRPEAFELTFPSGFTPPDDGSWPAADVHNAREAAWARDQPTDVVQTRLDSAITHLRQFLTTVTDEEATTHAGYYADIAHHLDVHRTTELTDP